MIDLLQRVYALLCAIADRVDEIPADIVDAANELEPDVTDAIQTELRKHGDE